MSDDLEDVTAWVVYCWTCPHCDEVNDEGDVEPAGETQCGDCGAVVNITGAT